MIASKSRSGLAIFWISVLGLYLELLLIRWVSTEIRIFAYLQNTVLVVCFLGLGIGLFRSRRPISATRGLLSLLILAGALALPPTRRALGEVSHLLSVLGEVNIWSGGHLDSPALVAAALVMGSILALLILILILEPFVPIGQLLGRLMDSHPRPIVAYSVNVAGSLAGIWLFVGLSRLAQPPEVWFAVLLLLALPYFAFRKPVRWGALVILTAITVLVGVARLTDGAIETVWSPYQKLALYPGEDAWQDLGLRAGEYHVEVNNTGYQLMLDLSALSPDSDSAGPTREHSEELSSYDVPSLVHPMPQSILIVGAGTGNDVAGALRHGVSRITAVEIDPAIVALGREYHPERPYDSDDVRVVTTDARSFFATTTDKYDIISFGFLDSHTTTAMTNARLDHYVYTRESISRAKSLLREGGVLSLAFLPVRPFIADRMATVLRDVFGDEPLAFTFPFDWLGSSGILYLAGDLETMRARIDDLPELERLRRMETEDPVAFTYTTPPATDDWPYIYLESPRIPLLFPLLAGLLGILVLYARRTLDLPVAMNPVRWDRANWHFFFLGAAFLLLEVQNISKAAVVLGNTWLVNAVIISGVLMMILVANAIVLRWPRIPLGPVYALLLATVFGLYFLDLARFAFLAYPIKAAVVGALTCLPMAFSGIAFARAFAVADGKDIALGANLLGALVGAVLQSLSFLLGIKALLLVVAAFYFVAMLTRPERRPSASLGGTEATKGDPKAFGSMRP
jgi:spermidine synthase